MKIGNKYRGLKADPWLDDVVVNFSIEREPDVDDIPDHVSSIIIPENYKLFVVNVERLEEPVMILHKMGDYSTVYTLHEDGEIVKAITDLILLNGNCTCGAKHTSNPGYHLSYCDLKA